MYVPRATATPSRRSLLSLLTLTATATAPLPFSYDPHANAPSLSLGLQPPTANAADTIGKDPSCNSPSCLGVWDGLLADCPHGKLKGGGAGCVSSQDDTPGIFAEPWDYSDSIPLPSSSDAAAGTEASYAPLMDRLVLALQTTARQRGDEVRVVSREGRYLRARFADGASGETSVGEFYFTPNDTTVQFRLASTGATTAASFLGRSLSNAERSERLRKALGYLKIPVLRNRRRAFFFAESDALDGFGPTSAALGPPEEMSPGEMVLDGAMRGGFKIMGGRGSEDVDPKLRIDWVEQFPVKK